MTKFFSDEFFKEAETALTSDPKWQEATKTMKSTILLNATDISSCYLVNVDSGTTTIAKVEPSTPAEFSFDGTYEVWSRLG
jgi:hypothetical protein